MAAGDGGVCDDDDGDESLSSRQSVIDVGD